jgi:hypothetical protein
VLVIVLAAIVAGRTASAAVWAACVLVPFALLLPSFCHSHRDAPQWRPPRPDRNGRPGAVLYDSADYPTFPEQAGNSCIYRDSVLIEERGRDSDSGRALGT